MTCPVCGLAIEARTDSCPSCGADLVLLAPGEIVGERYEIVSLLGRGGMGCVYRAYDRVLHDEVALKMQRADAAREPHLARRFRNEVRLARQITHPNVCRLYDGWQEGSCRWISMELVDGKTLAARLCEAKPPLEEAWSLAVQAADGLGAVHRAGVVHRDVKPLNLMVDAAGRVRLMDFGIAKPAATSDTGGYVLGSPEYMSPEHARGGATDARSDVYSLGVVLFELFAGAVPFSAETPVATLLQHLQAQPALERLPGPLRPVLARALAKDPDTRYADGATLAEALRVARGGRPDLQPARRETPRRLRLWPAGAAALGLLGIAAIALLSQRGTEAPVVPQAGAASERPAVDPSRTPPSAPPQPVGGGQADRAQVASATKNPPATTAHRPRILPQPEATTPTPPPTPSAPPPASAPDAAPSAGPGGVAPGSSAPLAIADGALLVLVKPWADVSVDEIPRGQIPLGPIRLAPGPHSVLIVHPAYLPYRRKVTIRSGETLRLAVDLASEGVRRRQVPRD